MDNLRRIVSHLLSTSFGEVFLIAGSLAFALPLPVLPVQILWMNIVQEGFLNFAFAFEPEEKGLMSRDPRSTNFQGLVTAKIRSLILSISLITGIFTFVLFLILHRTGMPLDELRTVMFVALSLDALFFTLSLKDFYSPVWKISLFNNKYLLGALGISTFLLFVTFLYSPLSKLLSLTPLNMKDVAILVGVALFNLLTIEIAKYFIFTSSMRTHSVG